MFSHLWLEFFGDAPLGAERPRLTNLELLSTDVHCTTANQAGAPDLFQSLEGAADSHWMHPEALGCLIDRDPSVVAKRGQEGSLPLLGCQRSLDGHLTPLTPVGC